MSRWVKPTMYIQFYYSPSATEENEWIVWSREFMDATKEKPVENSWREVERYTSEEAAMNAANEFQTVSNK